MEKEVDIDGKVILEVREWYGTASILTLLLSKKILDLTDCQNEILTLKYSTLHHSIGKCTKSVILTSFEEKGLPFGAYRRNSRNYTIIYQTNQMAYM
jgi:hypothetical protein